MWKRLKTIEGEINTFALKDDQAGLDQALIEYETLVLRMTEEFGKGARVHAG